MEHRLFSHTTMNWAGRPLTGHEVTLSSIAAPTTRAGLSVTAEPDSTSNDTGATISNKQLAALPIDQHTWHDDWNHTLQPEPPTPVPAPAPFDEVNPS